MDSNTTQGTHTPAPTAVNMKSMNTLTHGEFVENKRRRGTSIGQVVPWIVLAYLLGVASGIFMTQTVECEMKESKEPIKTPDRAEGECSRLQAELNYLKTTISRQFRDSQTNQQQWERVEAQKEKEYQEQWMRSQQMWEAQLQNRLEMMQRQWNIEEANRVAEEEQHLAQNLEQQFTPMMVSPGYGAMPPPLPYQQESFDDFNEEPPMLASSPYIDEIIDGTIMDETQNDSSSEEEDEILPTLEMSPSMMVDTATRPSASSSSSSSSAFRSGQSVPARTSNTKMKRKKSRKSNK
mgnify:CR=1 FL=1